MKRIFMRGNPGDFANYVAALTAVSYTHLTLPTT